MGEKSEDERVICHSGLRQRPRGGRTGGLRWPEIVGRAAPTQSPSSTDRDTGYGVGSLGKGFIKCYSLMFIFKNVNC